jgi:hypothetical protein
MKGVPGVMVLLSATALFSLRGTWIPCLANSSRSRSSSASFSWASCAARKRRERCWFILARGATPSMAM